MKNIFRISVAVPEIRLGNPEFNSNRIIDCINNAIRENVHLLIFPEHCLTGNVGDLFFQETLIKSILESIKKISENIAGGMKVLISAPIKICGELHLCAVMLEHKKICFVAPNHNLSDVEKRWFSDSPINKCELLGQETVILQEPKFKFNGNSAEISFSENDLDTDASLLIVMSGAPYAALNDEHIISGAKFFSRKGFCLAYAGSPVFESTTDSIHCGLGFICDRGEILEKTEKFKFSTQQIHTDIDFDITKNKIFEFNFNIDFEEKDFKIKRKFSKYPFIPENEKERLAFFEDVLKMQASALARRALHVNCETLVVGVSGGLDSTLSLVAAVNAVEVLGKDRKNVIAVTMPGFGTSGRTKSNAEILLNDLGVTPLTIPISEACEGHFRDIGHSGDFDAAFENSQARERTQILLDLANMRNGIVVGTGDMTESALGFATFNGDHISNYNVNGNIPKTLVRALVRHLGNSEAYPASVCKAFLAISDTPISPELLPTDEKGEIAQKTETIIGPYDLNDFIMYYVVKHGLSKDKISFMAGECFSEYSPELINATLDSFYKRFLINQFKRSCSPDGVKVLDFSLSPRGGLILPSDCDFSVFKS